MAGKRLSFEIGLILCAKLAALTLLYFAFFSAPPHADSRAVAAHLTSGP
jgi:hypothetical protein